MTTMKMATTLFDCISCIWSLGLFSKEGYSPTQRKVPKIIIFICGVENDIPNKKGGIKLPTHPSICKWQFLILLICIHKQNKVIKMPETKTELFLSVLKNNSVIQNC